MTELDEKDTSLFYSLSPQLPCPCSRLTCFLEQGHNFKRKGGDSLFPSCSSSSQSSMVVRDEAGMLTRNSHFLANALTTGQQHREGGHCFLQLHFKRKGALLIGNFVSADSPKGPLSTFGRLLTPTLVFSSNNTMKNAVTSSHMNWSHRPEKLQGLFIHCFKEQILALTARRGLQILSPKKIESAKHQGGTSPTSVFTFLTPN